MPRKPRTTDSEQPKTQKPILTQEERQRCVKIKRRAEQKFITDIASAHGLLAIEQARYADAIADLHRFFQLHAKGHVRAESAWVPSHWVRVFVPYSIFCCLLASIATQKIQQRYVLVFESNPLCPYLVPTVIFT